MTSPSDTKILLNTGPSERGWHRVQDIVHCPRKYAFRRKLGLGDDPASDPTGPLPRGSLVHVGLAHHYAQLRAVQRGEDPGRYWDPCDAIDRAAAESFKAYEDVDLVKDIVRCYQAAYAGDRSRVLMVEEQVAVTVKNKWLFTQRYDRVVEDSSGRVWVIDAKTSSAVSARTMLGYGMSGQLLAAQVIGRLTWPDRFAGVRLDFIGVRPEEKLPFRYPFTRETLPPAPYAEQTVVDTIEWAEQIVERLEAGNADPWKYPAAHHEHACMTRYGPCQFYDLCRWGPGGVGGEP